MTRPPPPLPAQIDGPIRLERWSGTQASERLDDVVSVYKEAFLDVYEADPQAAAADRRVHVAGHLRRPDVSVVAALDAGDRLAGVTYAVPGQAGTWWHDVVVGALPKEVAQEWMSEVCEVVELHVRPPLQGLGLGRALLRAVLADSPARTAALSALDDPTLAARHLYASEGFVPLLTGFCFPGGPTRYAILGKRLR